eukprot:CAMPEP_0169442824 /NCGR_PEP_ID=MMETSP1042-20121227/9031_1 /TAXON_ID=464988 /ORGANISM="Hemiselmis andersenii, Strain CCMP1180" /LENGTH=35 /DNA_ID= /DNA_START= /DNA_END= /DNA_ORIENTATION=
MRGVNAVGMGQKMSGFGASAPNAVNSSRGQRGLSG